MNAIDVPKIISSWLQGSEEEWEVATKLAELHFFSQAHFHLHLSLEKQIKAIIVLLSGAHAPYSQSLSFLLGKTSLEPSETQLQWLGEITDFNLTGMYAEEKHKTRRELNELSWKIWHPRAQELKLWLKLKSHQN